MSNLSGIDRSWPALRTVVVDLAIAATVCAGALIFEVVDAGDVGASLDAVDFAACAGAAALILLRRRAPLPVLVVAVIAAVWSLIPDDDQVCSRSQRSSLSTPWRRRRTAGPPG